MPRRGEEAGSTSSGAERTAPSGTARGRARGGRVGRASEEPWPRHPRRCRGARTASTCSSAASTVRSGTAVERRRLDRLDVARRRAPVGAGRRVVGARPPRRLRPRCRRTALLPLLGERHVVRVEHQRWWVHRGSRSNGLGQRAHRRRGPGTRRIVVSQRPRCSERWLVGVVLAGRVVGVGRRRGVTRSRPPRGRHPRRRQQLLAPHMGRQPVVRVARLRLTGALSPEGRPPERDRAQHRRRGSTPADSCLLRPPPDAP